MIVADIEEGKVRRVYAVDPEGNELDFPVDHTTKIAMNAHGSIVSLRLKVDRVIDVTD